MHKNNRYQKKHSSAKQSEKDTLRKKIAGLKKQFSPEEITKMSDEVFNVLEIIGVFQSAKNIFIYHSLPDEVSTTAFIQKWESKKNFYVPVVCENKLVFRACMTDDNCLISSFGIKEPCGNEFTDYNLIDLIIVPGVAFDRKMNRLGRGKGYYDNFLSHINVKKIGVCFDFQLFDRIPSDEKDIKMDIIVSENDLIW